MSLEIYNKINESKHVEGIFPDNHVTNLIKYRIKEIIKLQNSTEINDLNLLSKKESSNLSNNSLPVVILKSVYTNEGYQKMILMENL